MSGPNSGGGGINFNGPIQLSGLALSKKYILETMDNYVSFMSGMLSLFKEDVGVYATATQNSAKYESQTIKMQAWADLASGITSAVSAGVTGLVMMKGHSSDKLDIQKSDAAKSEMGNYDQVLDGVSGAESEALREPVAAVDEGEAGVGPSGAPGTTVEANIQKLESGRSRTYKAFGRDGTAAIGGSSDEMSFADAKVATKELVKRSRDPARTPAQRELAKKRLDNIKDRFREKSKIAQNDRQSADGLVTRNSQTRTQQTQVIQSTGQAISSSVKFGVSSVGDGSQASSKKQAVFAQSNQQLNQQILSSTEATAQKAAQNAQNLVDLERQIQANNITRG